VDVRGVLESVQQIAVSFSTDVSFSQTSRRGICFAAAGTTNNHEYVFCDVSPPLNRFGAKVNINLAGPDAMDPSLGLSCLCLAWPCWLCTFCS